jgi:hypothetical protein
VIRPGEFRLTVDYLESIVDSSDKITYILQDCRIIASTKMDAQIDDYRYKQMIAGFKLSQKSFWDSSNTYSVFYIQLVVNMVNLIKKQYGITFDQFLEEQYVDFSSLLYSKIPDFAESNSTNRLGFKRATWADIDKEINDINLSLYSYTRMSWDFIGSTNDI